MAKRRSFEEGLTADEEDFLKQGRAEQKSSDLEPEVAKPHPRKEESKRSESAVSQQSIDRFPAVDATIAPASPHFKISNLSVRIDSRIAAALLRAMTERRISGILPASQQDIVGEAVVDWLKKHGFIK